MPPTLPAARKTACGFVASKNLSTALRSVRSTVARSAVTTSQLSAASLRTSADPTMPRSPATNTRFELRRYSGTAVWGIVPALVGLGKHDFADDWPVSPGVSAERLSWPLLASARARFRWRVYHVRNALRQVKPASTIRGSIGREGSDCRSPCGNSGCHLSEALTPRRRITNPDRPPAAFKVTI